MGRKPFEERLLGQTLAGKYRLSGIQGAGFFSVVFLAQQYFGDQFVRPVAVKVSRQTGLTAQTAPQLFGDAIVLARLLANSDHEGRRHLVQVLDMGLLPEQDNRAYLVMEYVDGQPLLSHLLSANKLPAALGVRYWEQLATALSLVHTQGAVHRDLIPENILIDRRGQIKLVDFGLAAFTDASGLVRGGGGVTFAYAAPEMLRGLSSPASDIYSLGLVMYQLFTGGGPHLTAPWVVEEQRDTCAENYAIKMRLKFPPPSEFHNEIRKDFRWLDAILLRCLEADPSRRFADAPMLLAALAAAQAGRPLPEGNLGGALPQKIARQPGGDTDHENRFREVRKLLAARQYDQVIDLLDIHRPAEWVTLDRDGARTLRSLSQAYLGRGDLKAARECLEQLRSGQREQAVLPQPDYAAALTDLCKCYRGLGLDDLLADCLAEAQALNP
jgi:serine/threonine protein kinase